MVRPMVAVVFLLAIAFVLALLVWIHAGQRIARSGIPEGRVISQDADGRRDGEREKDQVNGADEGGPNAAIPHAVGGDIQEEAKALEKERDTHLKRADVAEGRHHRLTMSATLLHMGIAIATIAIIAGRRWPWLASLALGAVGSAIAIWAYL